MPLSITDRRSRLQQFIPPSPTSAYSVRIGLDQRDVEKAQRLRFEVFNRELGEGLRASEATGRDADDFDAVCDHLLIEHVNTAEVVGTYRLQSGQTALDNIGYYSEQEFDFSVFEGIRSETIELGRACISKEHRNMVVLGLLWKGIAQYAKLHDARYLIGCSSLRSTDPVDGLAAQRKLRSSMAPAHFLTRATPAFDCSCAVEESVLRERERTIEIPRLMRAYLTLGASICGSPALDREFGTIDFLTLLDLRSLGPRAMQKFLG